MSTCAVYDIAGKKIDDLALPEKVFSGRINEEALHQALVMYRANLRQGNASTKERGSVSGGGKKPYRQKGTGQARAGSSRSPLWKGGGVVFGPHPRDFGYTLPRKLKIVALKTSLNARFSTDDLCCVESLQVTAPKTKGFAQLLKTLKLSGKILVIADSVDAMTHRASRNIKNLSFVRSGDVTAYDILKNKKILVTLSSFKSLLKRINS